MNFPPINKSPVAMPKIEIIEHRGQYALMKVTVYRSVLFQPLPFTHQVYWFVAVKPQPRADHLAQFPHLLDTESGMWDKVAVANWDYYESTGEPTIEAVARARYQQLSGELENVYGG